MESENKPAANEFPKITVAVITRDRVSSLRRTLVALKLLDYPNYEILVVDNASEDETPKLVQEMGLLYLFSKKSNGFSRTRQIAVDAAQGEFIAWCDDDCVPDRNWLSAFLKRFQTDSAIALIGGQVINIDFPATLQFKGRSVHVYNGMLKFVENPLEASYFGNLNMAVRVSAVKAIGGYDPFFRGGYEEIDMAQSLLNKGFRVVYEPEAVVKHYHQEVAFKKGRLFWGGSLMRLYFYFKHFFSKESSSFQKFCSIELSLFIRDLRLNVRTFGYAFLHLNFRKVRVALIDLLNTCTSRLVIPWIWIRVRASRTH